MRESELVSKIIKEWEGLSSEEKETLFASYKAEKHISEDKSESSEIRISPGSSKSKRKMKSQNKGKENSQGVSSGTPVKTSGVRVFVRSSS